MKLKPDPDAEHSIVKTFVSSSYVHAHALTFLRFIDELPDLRTLNY